MDYEIENDEHNQAFVVLHNRVARDRTISRSARGLLAELLSYRAGTISFDTLLRNGSEKRVALRRMLRELEAAGYITRTKRRGERGLWQHKMIVRETPARGENRPLVPPAETQETAGGSTGRFSTGGRSAGGQPADKNEKTEDLEVPKDEKTKISLSAHAREETIADMLSAAVPSATEREIEFAVTWIQTQHGQGRIQSERAYLRKVIANGDASALVAASKSGTEAKTSSPEPGDREPRPLGAAVGDWARAAGRHSAMCRVDDHEHCQQEWCACPCGHRNRNRYPTSPYAA